MKLRLVIHIVFGVLAWVLFGYYWALVAQRRITENTIRGLVILALCVATIWLLTGLWVQHNRRRFAGRPDRRKRRAAPQDLPEIDAIGQPVEVEGDALDRAPLVTIDIDPETGTKKFTAALLPDDGSTS